MRAENQQSNCTNLLLMTKKYKYLVDLVAFHITKVCSHRCPMCYSAKKSERPFHYPIEKLIEITKLLIDSNVREITLLGGDPAAHPNVLDVAKYASDGGIKVSILSNTLSFKNSSPEEIMKYISSFEATIHHYIPEKHDDFCKHKEAFNLLVRNLQIYSRLGASVGIAINITPLSVNNIFRIVYTLSIQYNINIKYVIIQRIIPFGKAASTSDFTITRKQAEISLREIKKVKTELGVNVIIEDPVPLCILPEELREFVIPCQWGIRKVSINGNGELSRCGADPRYRLGNIFDTPLQEIWNSSPILDSFRKKKYLPGRCRICEYLMKCGGGCPLSCEIEKDHGLDYLYIEQEIFDESIHGKLEFVNASEDELSSILQIEWGNFSGYGHIFSVDDLRNWFKHNPEIFWVVRDSRKWILGYAVLVPISRRLFELIKSGRYSALIEFPFSEVLRRNISDYYHVEVIAGLPSKTISRAGTFLIKSVGQFLIKNAKYVLASPITDIGIKLCKYFNFVHIADELWNKISYPIYYLEVFPSQLTKKLERF